ncbi:hypothetical protein HanRHA438_Chr13g0625621 [Helianthus annuus]|nr:hypothetical protein HanRHA438_Chr13g0625621 [Helianthus annuus]
MSKTVNLHKSLTNSEIYTLKHEILNSYGVKTLVSSDETYVLQLACTEKLEELNSISDVVSRLGRRCTVPQLLGFEHDMDAMVRKMERYVNVTARLYGEMEVLSELEVSVNKFRQDSHEESRRGFEQKVVWQKQDVRHLKDVSLWNMSYDKVVEMLARTVCTLYARICIVSMIRLNGERCFRIVRFRVWICVRCRSLSQVSVRLMRVV